MNWGGRTNLDKPLYSTWDRNRYESFHHLTRVQYRNNERSILSRFRVLYHMRDRLLHRQRRNLTVLTDNEGFLAFAPKHPQSFYSATCLSVQCGHFLLEGKRTARPSLYSYLIIIFSLPAEFTEMDVVCNSHKSSIVTGFIPGRNQREGDCHVSFEDCAW